MNDVGSNYSLPIAGVRFEALVTTPLVLPPNAGSTLRGAFGHALREVSCIYQQLGQACVDQCRENAEAMRASRPTRCSYGYVFDTPRPPGSPLLERQSDMPHPYVFRMPPGAARSYSPGDVLHFDVHLCGMGVACLPPVIQACAAMTRRGLGPGRGTAIVRAMWELDPLELRTCLLLPLVPVLSDLTLAVDWNDAARIAESLPRQTVTLHFMTPTRLIQDHLPVQRPAFAVLMRALLRRLTFLALFHGGTIPTDLFKRLAAAAEAVHLVAWQGTWSDWARFSSRQGGHMTFGGLVGTATYEGDLGPFLPYLVLGQAVHVGKACTFGGGRYRILSDQPGWDTES